MGEPDAAATLRLLTLILIGLLIALVVAWTLSAGISAGRAVFALVLTLPLCAPLRGLVRCERRTYAWATLCVIPYFVMGLTESVANPPERLWSGACLALALLLFVGLIAYLRATRPR